MASGDRKIKIQQIVISYGNPVLFAADWRFSVEDNLGADRYITSGRTSSSFGTLAQFNAKTGSQLRTEVRDAVLADVNLPSNNDVS